MVCEIFHNNDLKTNSHSMNLSEQFRQGRVLAPSWGGFCFLGQKKALNEAIRLIMAKKVHESKFDPEKYLSEDKE